LKRRRREAALKKEQRVANGQIKAFVAEDSDNAVKKTNDVTKNTIEEIAT
jgi:hypothetical protein